MKRMQLLLRGPISLDRLIINQRMRLYTQIYKYFTFVLLNGYKFGASVSGGRLFHERPIH
jgi:hypothetical protein